MLAGRLYDWFRLGYLTGDASGAGLPVYYRRKLTPDGALHPKIHFEDAEWNVIILLADEKMVLERPWRSAAIDLAEEIVALRENSSHEFQALLLPVAMHDSFYRTGTLYREFNPIRLIDLSAQRMEST